MPKKAPADEPTRLAGKVIALNSSPKGQAEGALVETSGGVAQVNFSKHDESSLRPKYRVGTELDVRVEPESEKGGHPVYRVVDDQAALTGTIVRLNYSLHGEVNGYHLHEGTFIHVKPDGAKKLKLQIGQKVRATGLRRKGPDCVVMEATAVEKLTRDAARSRK